MTLEAVDCQGLAGAFTLGTKRAGFDIKAKYELPGGFGLDNTRANTHLLGEFPHEEGPQESWERHSVPYVFGNPPCSGFSLMNTSKGEHARGADSKINDCMWAFAEYAGTMPHAPEFAVFESVQGAFKQGRNLMQDLRDHMEELTGKKYRLTHLMMSGATVGAAATRQRYFWVELPERERPGTYRDAISDLMGLDHETWADQKVKGKPTAWLQEWDMLRDDGMVDAHVARTTKNTNALWVRRWKAVMDWWEPGEIYEKALKRAHSETGEYKGPWEPEEIQRKVKEDRLGFSQPRRVVWDKKAYVITGGGPSQYVHPEEDRFLTVRELARIQGFPDTWSFDGANGRVNLAGMWIGKGVPVQSGQFVSTWVKNSLEGNPGEVRGEEIGDNEYLIDITHHWKTWADD